MTQRTLNQIRNMHEAFECLKKMYEIAYHAELPKPVRDHIMSALILTEQEIDKSFLKMPVTIYIKPEEYDTFVHEVLADKRVQANSSSPH